VLSRLERVENGKPWMPLVILLVMIGALMGLVWIVLHFLHRDRDE
jgi:hypothetical protein